MRWHFCAIARGTIWLAALLALPSCTRAEANSAGASELSQAERLTRTALLLELEGERHCRDLTLRLALREDPDCAAAHWGKGDVRVRGKWCAYNDSAALLQLDADGREYRQLRDEALIAPKRMLRLARWCREQGWQDAERVFLTRLLTDPSVDASDIQEAVSKLGVVRVGDQYLTQEQVRELKATERRRQLAEKRWLPKVTKWHERLQSRQTAKRERALAELRDVDDPEAIPVLEAVLSPTSETISREVVGVLGRIPDYRATESLVRHAVGAPWPGVRDLAIDQLAQRPRHDYFPLLLYGLSQPIQTRFSVTVGANGEVRYDHVFFQEGPVSNQLETTTVLAPSITDPVPGAAGANVVSASQSTGDDASGLEEQERRVRQARQADRVMRQAQRVQEQTYATNLRIAASNQSVFEVLEQTSGELLPRNPATWWDWWQDYNDVETGTKPTVSRNYAVDLRPRTCECFPSGTEVWTRRGLVDISTIKIGDRVLSQNADTGELAYKLVVDTTVRRNVPLVTLSMDDRRVTCTKGHPLWIVGSGWRMAKRIEIGDRIHSLGPEFVVEKIEEALPTNAYNLVVDGFNSYFVTPAAVLAHDNTYRSPTTALIPGLLAEHRK